jgi:hypothetical protein
MFYFVIGSISCLGSESNKRGIIHQLERYAIVVRINTRIPSAIYRIKLINYYETQQFLAPDVYVHGRLDLIENFT